MVKNLVVNFQSNSRNLPSCLPLLHRYRSLQLRAGFACVPLGLRISSISFLIDSMEAAISSAPVKNAWFDSSASEIDLFPLPLYVPVSDWKGTPPG